jgi:hypothetical protein
MKVVCAPYNLIWSPWVRQQMSTECSICSQTFAICPCGSDPSHSPIKWRSGDKGAKRTKYCIAQYHIPSITVVVHYSDVLTLQMKVRRYITFLEYKISRICKSWVISHLIDVSGWILLSDCSSRKENDVNFVMWEGTKHFNFRGVMQSNFNMIKLVSNNFVFQFLSYTKLEIIQTKNSATIHNYWCKSCL